MDVLDHNEIVRGIRQFNAGRFFDCHDTIEKVWLETHGPEKLFIQGLIQVAVAYYHSGNGNYSAAISQLTKAMAKLQKYPGVFLELEVDALLTTLRLHKSVYQSVLQKKFNPMAAKELKAPQIIVH